MSEGEKKELTTEQMPTLRNWVVNGQHQIHSGLEMLLVLKETQPQLVKSLAVLHDKLQRGIERYFEDVENLERALREKEKEAQDYATKLVEVSAALEMEKALTKNLHEECDRRQAYQLDKNQGFAEAKQALNKKCSEMENAKEIAEQRVTTHQLVLNKLRRELDAEHETNIRLNKRICELLGDVLGIRNWLRKKGIRLPRTLA